MRISDWSSDVCSSDLPSGGIDGQVDGNRDPQRKACRQARAAVRRARPVPGSHANGAPLLAPEISLCRQGKAAGAWRVSGGHAGRSEEHTSELQSLMRISYAVFCLKKKKQKQITS